jgi:hypothetical protein
LLFGERSFAFEYFLEGALFAEFGDEVAVVGAFEYFVAADCVGVVEDAGDGDFLLEQFLQFLEGEGAQLHDFDCDLLIAFLVAAAVDC